MDEIREEFECRARNMSYDLTMQNGIYTDHNTLQLKLGYLMAVEDYKSRDEEIKKLRDEIEHLKLCLNRTSSKY